MFLLANVAGVGTVNDLPGRFVDEVNSDVLHLGVIENIVHSAVQIPTIPRKLSPWRMYRRMKSEVLML